MDRQKGVLAIDKQVLYGGAAILVVILITGLVLGIRGIPNNGSGADEARNYLQRLEERQRNIDAKLDAISSGLADSQRKVEAISGRIAEAAGTVEAVAGRITESQERITSSQRGIEEGESILKQVRTRGKSGDN